MTTTTETQVEYLTDIKFRNAVKRTTRFNVFGKNDYGRYGVYIDPVSRFDAANTLFEVRYTGGDFQKNSEIQLRNQLLLERELTLGGFELVAYEKRESATEIVTAYAWKKVA
jgi:hypothetical protein